MATFENKVIKKKKLDKESSLLISKNEMSNRIFVDFLSEDGRLKLQKSFQDNFQGNKDSQEFAKSIKSIHDLRKYFRLPAVARYDPKKLKVTVNNEVVDTNPYPQFGKRKKK